MNIKQTTAAIKALGSIIAKRENGEWSLKYRATTCKLYDLNREDTAYYTNDNDDAMATALKMAEWLHNYSHRIEPVAA